MNQENNDRRNQRSSPRKKRKRSENNRQERDEELRKSPSKKIPLSLALRRQESRRSPQRKRKARKMLTFKPRIQKMEREILDQQQNSSSRSKLFLSKKSLLNPKKIEVKKNGYFPQNDGGSSTSINVRDQVSTKKQLPGGTNEELMNFDITRGRKKRLTRKQKRMMTMQLINKKRRMPSINFDLEVENGEDNKEENMSKDDKRKAFKNRFRSMTFTERRTKPGDNKNKSSKKLLIINEE